jgi:hypothetical protein
MQQTGTPPSEMVPANTVFIVANLKPPLHKDITFKHTIQEQTYFFAAAHACIFN